MYRPRFVNRLLRYSGWGYPDVLRLRSSLFINCVPILFFVMVFTALVAVLYEVFGYNVVLPETMLNTVSLVVAILLGFRMTDAYEHYYKCRELFCSMITEIRNAIRKIWIGVQEIDDSDRQDKEKYIKQLFAFAIAVKHQLRLEYGSNWLDLKDLLPDELYIHEAAYGNIKQDQLREMAHRIPPITYRQLHNLYSTNETTIWLGSQEWGIDVDASMSLPLEIIFHIESFIYKTLKNESIKENTYDSISENLSSLVDIFGKLEKICRLPLPHFYIIHLKQIVLLYVLLLPFALIEKLGWFVIPAVGLIAFILFGLEIIGAGAIQPLGYDYTDLPLDGLCQELEAEITFMIRHLSSVKEVSHSIEIPVT